MKNPSDFVAARFPNCSIFGDTWYEMTALVILRVMVLKGDKWIDLTIKDILGFENYVRSESLSIFRDQNRIQKVLDVLKDEEDARNFSPFWAKV